MYSIRIRNISDSLWTEIHSPTTSKLKLMGAKVVKDVTAIDAMSFSIDPTHPSYNNISYLKTLIEVWSERLNKLVFKGRLLEPSDKMESDGSFYKSYDCESELAYLHDSVQDWGEFRNLSPKAFFGKLIDVHNSQVESYKQFKVGEVTVTNSTDNVYRFTDDEADTYDTIQDKLISRLGGELQLRYENDGTYIDYLEQIGGQGQQEIVLSRNLLSVSRKIDPSDLITVLKPLGANQEQEGANSGVSSPRLTIKSVNNDSPFLEDTAKIAQFGRIVGVQTYNDINKATILKTRGLQLLASQKTALEQYQIDAVDLSLVDLRYDDFKTGWTYRILNPIMGIDDHLRIVGQSIDLCQPENSTLSIGDKILSQEQYNSQLRKQAKANAKLQITVYNQTMRINELSQNLQDAKADLESVQGEIDSGSGEVQSQIATLIDNMQDIITEINTVKATIPTTETMADIAQFMTAQNQLNTDFEARLQALEESDNSDGL